MMGVWVKSFPHKRWELNFVAILCVLLAGLMLFEFFTGIFNNNEIRRIEGNFHNYEVIILPNPRQPSRKSYRYDFKVGIQTYLIDPKVHDYFRSDEFQKEVSLGDRIVVYVDKDGKIVGIEANGKTYLSCTDAQRATAYNLLLSFLLFCFFISIAIFLLLFVNSKKFQRKTNEFFELIMSKLKHLRKR